MFVRIATFEIPKDMPREAGEKVIEAVRQRMAESDDRPEGAQRLVIAAAPGLGRVVNMTFFDTGENMEAAEPFFDAMTPVQPEGVDAGGRRLDVSHFEVMLDEDLG